MPNTFSEAERNIRRFFRTDETFILNGMQYTVLESGKPTCADGEPKTDIYVRANSKIGQCQLKISYKKQNADFLENKMSVIRAEQIFGPNWDSIIINALKPLQKSFAIKPLIFKEKYRKTNAGSITLGWKFELLNKKSGALSDSMHLSREQIIDVYSGTNLSFEKRNAYVNGHEIPDCGIANYFLYEENEGSLTNIQEVIDSLISIDQYVDANPQIFFACKALNYRTYEGIYDGNRPLAVFVDWSVRKNQLVSELSFDVPLIYGGDYAYERLHEALIKLGVRSVMDLNASNVYDSDTIWNG